MGVASTRHIAAGALYREHALAKNYTGMSLDFERLQAVTLCLGKAINLFVGKTNVGCD